MRLEDFGGVIANKASESGAAPTAPANPPNLPNSQTTLNSPANTIIAYTIPIITLAIANLDTITLAVYH